MSYSRPSLMKIASASQFYIFLPRVQHPFSIVCLKCESASRCFPPGGGHCRGLLRDYEPSDGPSFEALRTTDQWHSAAVTPTIARLWRRSARTRVSAEQIFYQFLHQLSCQSCAPLHHKMIARILVRFYSARGCFKAGRSAAR